MQEIIAVNNYTLIRGKVSSKKTFMLVDEGRDCPASNGFSMTLVQKVANEDCAEFQAIFRMDMVSIVGQQCQFP